MFYSERRFALRLVSLGLALSIGTQAAAAQDLERLHTCVAEVSAARLEQDVRTLVGFGTRHTASETESEVRGIGAARRWIQAEFERIGASHGGNLEVFLVARTISGERRLPDPVEVVSVLAIQRGSVDPERYVMMSGDIDSRVSDVMDATSDSPGANDNASGMAGVLEAARVLGAYEFAGSIIYAGLAGEEQGLFGGKIVGDFALEQGWRIKAVLNNDMIGNIAGIDGIVDNHTARVFSEGTRANESAREARQRRFTGGEVDSPSRNLARFIDRQADRYLTDLDVMLIYRLDRFGRGGHHSPFNDLGIPGVRIMEAHEHYDRQHQDLRVENGIHYGDVIEGVNFDYARKLTALNVASLGELAMAPPFPAGVAIQGAVNPSTTLSWKLPSENLRGNLAGYRVHWRLTDAPQWTHSRFVGLTESYTLENLVIDNYCFGVSSVAKDGAESPVVFPGAAGSFGE